MSYTVNGIMRKQVMITYQIHRGCYGGIDISLWRVLVHSMLHTPGYTHHIQSYYYKIGDILDWLMAGRSLP